MGKRGRLLAWCFLGVFLISLVSSAGICALDKETYHPGETATITCSCTLPGEEGQAGDFIFRNSSNDILQNTSTNSNLCRTGVFGASFTFPSGADYLGNATFDTSAGSWSGDIVSDNFNVSGAHINDCIIINIKTSQSITVGSKGAVKFEVVDPISGQDIVHASCMAEGYDVNGNPLIFEPDSPGNSGYKPTTANGEVGFTHDLTEKFWETNTTYLFEFHCYSLPLVDNADIEHIGFLANGTASGMKTCTTQALFTTGDLDLRAGEMDTGIAILYIILTVGVFIIFLIALYIQIKLDYNDKIDSRGDTILIPKQKYVKIMMTAITYPLFTWFLNLLVGLSNFAGLSMFSGYLGFMFFALLSLSEIVFWIVGVITVFILMKDAKLNKIIDQYGSATRNG